MQQSQAWFAFSKITHGELSAYVSWVTKMKLTSFVQHADKLDYPRKFIVLYIVFGFYTNVYRFLYMITFY